MTSKRRALGEEGEVKHVGNTATTNLKSIAESKGLGDPKVSFLVVDTA